MWSFERKATTAELLLWLAVSSGGCADILGLEPSIASPSTCQSDDQCATSERCREAQCIATHCAPEQRDERRCVGHASEQCDADGVWSLVQSCDAGCRNGVCRKPPSCVRTPVCAGSASCCQTDTVPGGTFDFQYAYGQTDGSSAVWAVENVKRSVPRFELDRFEVTVDRFRIFISAFADLHLHEGDGARPDVAGSGWREAWNIDPTRIPATTSGLTLMLNRNDQSLDNAVAGDLPVRGVNWYVAFAFCFWDGGRLPTEAEWQFAAAGGEEKRRYPWADVDLGAPVDEQRACYSPGPDNVKDAPLPVGSKPDGQGRYGHDDLAGNVNEWVLDEYSSRLTQLTQLTCDASQSSDCAADRSAGTRVIRGGSFQDPIEILQNDRRRDEDPDVAEPTYGFRCAYPIDRTQR